MQELHIESLFTPETRHYGLELQVRASLLTSQVPLSAHCVLASHKANPLSSPLLSASLTYSSFPFPSPLCNSAAFLRAFAKWHENYRNSGVSSTE